MNETKLTDQPEKDHGTILIVPVDKFFSEYLKSTGGNLSDYEVIIISKDIIADISIQTSYGSAVYKSRYKYVDFAPNLYPSNTVMEYYYGASKQQFAHMYHSQLGKVDNLRDICSIVDLVVNEKKNVIILCSRTEYKIEFHEYFKDFVFANFGLQITTYTDYIENPSSIDDIGDVKKIKEYLQFQLKNNDIIDDTINVFINKYAEDMVGAYREILMSKTQDDLVEIGKKHDLYISKYRSKEYNVDNIINALIGDTPPWSND